MYSLKGLLTFVDANKFDDFKLSSVVALEIDSALTRGIFPSKKSFGLVPNGSFGLVLLCLFRFCKLKISKCSSSLFTVTSFFLN